MKTWKIIVAVVIGIGIAIGIYFMVTYDEPYFNKVNVPEKTQILNRTDIKYLDTIMYVGMELADLHPKVVVIQLLDDSNSPKVEADRKIEAYIYGNSNQYIIKIRKMSRKQSITVLAHELIHMEQIERGDLIQSPTSIIWKSDTYTQSNVPNYGDRGWEYEAEKESVQLRAEIKAILYSK